MDAHVCSAAMTQRLGPASSRTTPAEKITARQADAEALVWMQVLSPSVTYFEPPQRPSTPGSEPDLILMLSWMGARPSHIAKYTARYRHIYPSSRLLIAQCPFSHIMFPWRTRRDLLPALPHLRDLSNRQVKTGDSSPRLLVHVFSNGGIHTASHITNMLRGDDPRHTLFLPRYVLILDSCPGYFRWMSSYKAMMQVLPWWSGPVVHAVIAIVCLYHVLRRLPAIQDRNAKALRSPALLDREVRRTCIYATEDDLIPWRDVEHHAMKAREAGFSVRLEKFVGGRHVAVVRSDPERYWKLIQSSWQGQ